MAHAGKVRPCRRMQIEDGKLVTLSTNPNEASTETSDDVDAIVARLLAGEMVHVSNRYPIPDQVNEAIAAALQKGTQV